MATAGGALVALLAAFALWWSGLLGPNLAQLSGWGWGPTERVAELDGSGGTVEVQLELDNRGLFDVVVEELHAGFLEGAHVELDGPVTIPARGSGRLHFDLVVEACDRMVAPTDPMLTFSGRSGPLPFAGRSLSIGSHLAQVATWDRAPVQDRASWWYQLAQSVCDPEAMAP